MRSGKLTIKDDADLIFLPGLAFNLQPVQPIAVKHPFKYLDPSWVDAGPSLGGLCWRVLSQIYNKVNFCGIANITGKGKTACIVFVQVELQYLPVYHPSAEERQNSILYASNVQKVSILLTLFRC